MNKEIIPVIFFTAFFVLAIIIGNWFLTFVLQRPLSEIPTFAKVIVHGITLTILVIAVKKFYVH